MSCVREINTILSHLQVLLRLLVSDGTGQPLIGSTGRLFVGLLLPVTAALSFHDLIVSVSEEFLNAPPAFVVRIKGFLKIHSCLGLLAPPHAGSKSSLFWSSDVRGDGGDASFLMRSGSSRLSKNEPRAS